MKMLENIVAFPCDAQSSPFFGALSSALIPALGITEDTAFYCVPKGTFCVQCGGCGQKTALQKHHLALYHDYQTATGVSFGWAWPEDDDALWRWPDEFWDFIMRYAGLSWRRLGKELGREALYEAIVASIDEGFPALLKLGNGPDWHVATGYGEGVLYGLDAHKHHNSSARPQIRPDRYTDDGLFVLSNWYEPLETAILITGRVEPAVTLEDVLARIIGVLKHPAHAALEREVMRRIDQITPDNASDTAKWLSRLAGFPIEARWHAAEAFAPGKSPVYGILRLTDSQAVRKACEQLFLSYIADNRSETHGVCWKIWGLLGVGPKTGYRLPPDADELVLRSETRQELERLFALVFENDRTVLHALREAQQLLLSPEDAKWLGVRDEGAPGGGSSQP